MSSIYQKGRDGYYYYQTYVYNPETGKKDKRIFHSLGTRQKSEAEIKQGEYDLQYEKVDIINPSTKTPILSKQNIKYLFLVISTVLITLTIIEFGKPTSRFDLKDNQIEKVVVADTLINSKKNNQFIVEKIKNNSKSNIDEQMLSSIKPQDSIKLEQARLIIPNYAIQKIDRLSGTFDQAKIYVTVDKDYNESNLKNVCKDIKNKHSEFSNIIICVYLKTESGLEIIKNQDRGINSIDQKNAWLAMYSYNEVEGEYYDSDPGRYLGNY